MGFALPPSPALQQRGWTVSGADFRKLAKEVRTDWHLGCIPSRPDWSIERELFRSGIAEILSLRLRVAYMPLLQGLQRLEDRVSILTTIREDPYAPKADGRERIKVS